MVSSSLFFLWEKVKKKKLFAYVCRKFFYIMYTNPKHILMYIPMLYVYLDIYNTHLLIIPAVILFPPDSIYKCDMVCAIIIKTKITEKRETLSLTPPWTLHISKYIYLYHTQREEAHK